MHIRITIVLLTVLSVSFMTIHAGEVRTWKPDELLERSEVVIIGRPTQITATGKKGTIRFGHREEGREIPIAYYTAKVRVVKVIKGDNVKEEITLTYSQVDYTRTPDIVHVCKMNLRSGGFFVFYLNPEGEGYVGALNDEFHDGQAASPIRLESTEKSDAARAGSKTEGDQ